jgi:hypothetical protein
MAGTDSVVQINEGSGKYLGYVSRSIASNTVYQQQTIIAEAYLPTYTATATTAMTMGANDHLFELQGSTLNRLVIRSIEVHQLANATAVVAAVQLIRTTTAGSGGTNYAPTATDPTSAVTSATFHGGLSSSKGTESTVLAEWTMPMLAAAGTAPVPALFKQWIDPRVQPPTIAAGNANGLALKLITAVTSGTVHITVTFSELYWS